MIFLWVYLGMLLYLGMRAAFLIQRGKTAWKVGGGLLIFAGMTAVQAGTFLFELPRFIAILFAWMSNTLVTMIPLMLCGEAVFAVIRYGFRREIAFRRIGISAAGAAALLAAAGTAEALSLPKVHTQEIEVRGLPKEFDGYSIAFISDLHASCMTGENYPLTVVCRTNAAGADLVLLGGDFADGTPAKRRRALLPLGDLRSKDGVYAVPGNHEYFNGYEELTGFLTKDCGVKLLVNANTVIEKNGAKLAIAGVADPVSQRYGANPGIPKCSLQTAMEGIPEGVPAILAAHQPKVRQDAMKDSRIVLQLSGHTHGGMIAGVREWLIAPFNAGVSGGLYDFGGMKLYVSSGAGIWRGFAYRLGVPPEITKIVLLCTEDED